MHNLPPSTTKLIEEFAKLPGIGMKTAQRLTYFLLNNPPELTQSLANALLEARQRILYCSQCFNMSEIDPCAICTSPDREQKIICVVEKPLDAIAIEKTSMYKGAYHVLHGAINPLDGIGPKDLRIAELLARVKTGKIREVILATNSNIQGEFTSQYIAQQLQAYPVQVTTLARGLPTGSELEYADQITITQALQGRRQLP